DAAAVALDDLLDDGEARTRPAPELVPPVEALEDAEDGLVVLGRDADAVVPHVEDGRSAVAPVPGADLDPLLRLVVVLDGVGDEVVEHLAHPHPVAPDARAPPG